MSVASTKAFYSQIAAGFLLAWAIAAEVGGKVDAALVEGLRALPAALEATVARRPHIAAAAQQLAPSNRYWAVVGNGTNRIAAEELRIKLSELCYKAIACDATEDKKHIDLSSEPMILVCAAGLEGSTADDVAKEVAIYRAHKATPIVDVQRRRGALRGRPPGPRRARRPTRSWPSCWRRWPGTCSATRRPSPSTRRRSRSARPAPRSRTRWATPWPPMATSCSAR